MSETILIVEDDPSIQKGLQLNLQLEGYQVLCASDGVEGLRLFQAESPSLIILDLMLPSLTGIDLLRELRAQDQRVAVLVLSAKGQEADKVLALSLGADDYVTKPFGLAELLARVRASLRRNRQVQPPRRPAQGQSRVVLDLPGRRVLVDGREVETTAREFDLLRHFVQNPGRAFTREQLMQRVWGDDYFGTPRTIDNFIARLRTKIEVDADAPLLLETIRGVGYRFNP